MAIMQEKSSFRKHLSNSLRIKIAVSFARQEMRKLLPKLRSRKLWRSIDKQIEKWPKELSIKNFWNAIHGMSIGFRLKSIVPWITSKNINWEEKNMPIQKLWFGGRFGPIASLNIKEKASDLQKELFKATNKELLKETRKKLVEVSSDTAPRDSMPIFAVYKENAFRVIDGNRRLLQAVVDNKNSIKAFVGKPVAKPELYEHWVPTSLLIDLVFWYERQIQEGRDATNSVAKTISELIRNSSAAQMEFKNRSVHQDNKVHMKLFRAVSKILNN